ncbi:metalloregulator ArsR/SmtB family transcription factor [Microbacterium sp.]|uniref:metalloregulator ArsR/SmtB family transcription factor n=1 Tax=Microbacterium sp. TaxID=51671 RepID=UPI003F703F66
MSAVVSARSVSVLADPTRAAILRLMLATDDGRVLVGRTAETLGLRQPTVSHHMRALLDEGIVTREPSGRQTWYAIAPEHRERIRALFLDESLDEVHEVDLDRVIDNLVVRFDGAIDRAEVERYVIQTHDLLKATSNPRLLGSRTAAFTADRIETAVRVTDVPEVLFVCVQNAGRSQIAAAVLRHLAGESIRVRTAGSAPSDDVRSSIVAALDEIGIPLVGEFPKPLTDDVVRAADVVITMGCGDVCATYPGTTYLDWDVDDPVGRPLSEVRAIRDEITRRVHDLLPVVLTR